MADTISFIQGSDTLVLNTGDYKVDEIDLTSGPPDALTHMPDYGESRVVRTEDKDRRATLQMRIIGADWDDVYNNIATIRRWLNEAARAEVDGDTDTVYLQLKRGTGGSTATNATNNRIRYGWVDGDSSAWSPYGQNVEQALVIFVHLVLTPYGDRATAITLKNEMFSSPHFVEYTGGIGDGWIITGVNTGLTISTAHYLIGGSCQKITTTADVEDQGIASDVVTVAANVAVVGYAWVAKLSGTDTVLTIALKDSAGVTADSKEFNPAAPANYDKMIVAPPGSSLTWYRYSLSDDGTGPRANAGIRLSIYRDDTDTDGVAVFLVDACYIGFQAGVPQAWASVRNTDCRNDIVHGVQATENYLNYVDVALIPGDAPALVTYKIDVDDGGMKTYIMGRVVDGDTLAVDQPHWIESEESPAGLTLFTEIFHTETGDTGAWTDPADAATSRGEYVRYTEDDDETGGGTYSMVAGASTNLRDFFKTPHRMYMAVRTNAAAPTAVTFKLDINVNYSNPVAIMDGNTVSPATANTWYLKDCGYFNPVGVLPPEVPNAATHPNSVEFKITVGGLAFNETADFDFIFAPWVGGDFIVFEARNEPTAGKQLWLVGEDKKVVSELDGLYEPGFLGSMWTLEPGTKTNRVTLMAIGSTDIIDITDAFTWEIAITSRTRHLLGTI